MLYEMYAIVCIFYSLQLQFFLVGLSMSYQKLIIDFFGHNYIIELFLKFFFVTELKMCYVASPMS